ncbi:MAG: histidinol-phosphate transaminase [Sulfolobales archaeon]
MRTARMHLNESPFEPSKLVSTYISKYVSVLNLYHVEELEREFLKKLSDYVKLPEEYVGVFPSSSEVLMSIIRFCRSRGLRLSSVWPSFHGFIEFAQVENVDVDLINLIPGSFELDLVKIAREGSSNKALYLANPNNPTSNMLFQEEETLDFLVNRFGLVVVDEAYFEFSKFTVADKVTNYDNLVVVRTFSKAFSLAGARVGYAIANPELLRELKRRTALFSVAITSLAAALGALEDIKYMEEIVSRVIELREELRESLVELGLNALDSRTNFLFVKLPTTGRSLAKYLVEKGIKVRSYDDELIRNYIRVSISSRENNLRFLRALYEYFKM